MKNWTSGVRGAVLMILTWTFGWGLGYGGFIEALLDRDGRVNDIWFTVLGIPGFIGGIAFVIFFRLANGGRGYGDVSLPRYAALGAAAGLVLGVITAFLGFPSETPEFSISPIEAFLIGPALGTIAGLASGAIFRSLARRSGATLAMPRT